MTRSLAISQRQVQSLIRAAEAEKAIVEVKVGNAIYRLIPKSRADESKDALDEDSSPAAFKTFEEYQAWRDSRAGKD
ncbi:MAG: hypothetical protein EOQ44_25080 [Mesorhizobium sp.]|uniref:hypothetical protein n=1 Tax=unclassified Mesorhizobium TaxID=325217 RepID=UPI000F75AE38|nr:MULTISPECIES: hypothetical protein [unclassified Mesorhizobium]AZO48091.1 hypothetical protein EJ073_09870 [Mesorhizobium sp. M4B.F.Ca.ET.058.02.1.1]RWB40421.1 MAG: hypothetical protein EOQ44_25080 [Mesorhizobium sp.]